MPRPSKPKQIGYTPDFVSFRPDGIPCDMVVSLSLEELETIRLIDHQRLTQEETAARMGVGRTTVTALYARARQKIAAFLIEGRALRIAGGSVVRAQTAYDTIPKGATTMRIAIPYENGMIFQHFGRTAAFKLYDVTDGAIVAQQVVNAPAEGHGTLCPFLKDQQVDVLICGGIGGGAQAGLTEQGLRLCGGVSGAADDAAAAYVAGTLSYQETANCGHHSHGEGGCGEHQHG